MKHHFLKNPPRLAKKWTKAAVGAAEAQEAAAGTLLNLPRALSPFISHQSSHSWLEVKKRQGPVAGSGGGVRGGHRGRRGPGRLHRRVRRRPGRLWKELSRAIFFQKN